MAPEACESAATSECRMSAAHHCRPSLPHISAAHQCRTLLLRSEPMPVPWMSGKPELWDGLWDAEVRIGDKKRGRASRRTIFSHPEVTKGVSEWGRRCPDDVLRILGILPQRSKRQRVHATLCKPYLGSILTLAPPAGHANLTLARWRQRLSIGR